MTMESTLATTTVLFGLGCIVLGSERLVALWRLSVWARLNAGFAVEKGQCANAAGYVRAKGAIQGVKVLGGLLCVPQGLLPEWALAPLLVGLAAVLIADRALEHVGGDGADQQLRIIGVALAMTFLAAPFDPGAKGACVGFLACQLALCYAVAGWCKARNPEWRRGDAIRCIAAAQAYGAGRFSPWLVRFSWLAGVVSWSVILFEATFPVYLFCGRGALVGLGLAFAFHLAIALGMRLNSFLWVFPISYPAFYAFSERIYTFLHKP